MVEKYLAALLEGHGVPSVVCEQIAYRELRVNDRAFKFRGRHIRRSGDYWTSFGNSVINCAITQAVADVVGGERFKFQKGLFEGDDGIFSLSGDKPLERELLDGLS